MTNQSQPFKAHHVVRALKAAVTAGVTNPSVEVHLPNGTTLVIGSGKPGELASGIPKPGKTPPRSLRAPTGSRK